MFSKLKKAPIKLNANEKNKVVLELEYLYDGDNPRMWIDYIVHYSSEKKEEEVGKNVFLGVAIYSQRYGLRSKHGETLVDNLFRLYIKPTILNDKISFHDEIYKMDDGNLRDERELLLLEEFMKIVFKKALDIFGISYSIEHDTLKVFANNSCKLDDWCRRRDAQQRISSEDPVDFKNVIMERLPIGSNAKSDGYILLALIGMIRSGEHIISAECGKWFKDNNFQKVIHLVNTNKNLTGVTELECCMGPCTGSTRYMNLNEIFGEVKWQLRYLEILIEHYPEFNNSAISFINSLNNIVDLRLILKGAPDTAINSWLLNVPRVRGIEGLEVEIMDGNQYLAVQGVVRSIASNSRVNELRMHDTGESLESFLVNHYRHLNGNSKNKLKALEVSGVGNLGNSMITSDLLSDLSLERLHVDIKECNDMAGLNQLVDKGIITRAGFKYLIISGESLDASLHRECFSKITELRNTLQKMKLMQWPTVVTSIEPTGIENEDYVQIAASFYKLHLNSKV